MPDSNSLGTRDAAAATANPAGAPRASSLDVFRAVVCLQIVAAHTFFGALYPVLTEHLGHVTAWCVAHLRFGFESFFVVAGYFLAHGFRPGAWSYLSVRAFFSRRLVRLALPYWVAVAFGLFGFQVSAWVRDRPYALPSPAELLPLLTFVQDIVPVAAPSAVYWFMAPLMQFYVAWAAVFWCARRWYLNRSPAAFHDRAVAVVYHFTTLALVSSLLFALTGPRITWALPTNAAYLAIGCLAYWRTVGLGGTAVLTLGVLALVALGLASGASRPIAAGVAALLLVRVAARPTLSLNAVTRVLAFIGHRSYSIYLTHTYVIYRVLNVPAVVRLELTPLGEVAVCLGAVGAAVVVGLVFYQLVERPLARASRRLDYRGELLVPPTSDPERGDARQPQTSHRA
jgi:exopolysaccharide production protein ExoZ